MAELTTEDLRMRQFLLGDLGEKEREELEQLVLIEGSTRDKLLMAEDDLIEEYLEGSLKAGEREKFLRQFLSIPHQRNKLRIAKSLRRFARDEANIETVPLDPRVLSEADIDPVPSQPRPVVQSKVLPFYRNLWVYVPIAAVILIAVIVGALWYASYRGGIEREAQRQVIERELAQLNASEEQNLPADQATTLIVPPFSPRSVVASSSSSFNRPILELWLLPGTKRTEKYNAVLQKVGSEDKYQIFNLQLHDRGGDKVVRLRIPTRFLPPGTYRVQLNGLSTGGTVTDTSEYNFEIH